MSVRITTLVARAGLSAVVAVGIASVATVAVVAFAPLWVVGLLEGVWGGVLVELALFTEFLGLVLDGAAGLFAVFFAVLAG
jgi:hypothetical protein